MSDKPMVVATNSHKNVPFFISLFLRFILLGKISCKVTKKNIFIQQFSILFRTFAHELHKTSYGQT